MNMLGAGDILWPLIWRARVHTIHLDRFSFLFFCRSPFSLATLNFCPIETQGRKETDGVLSPLQGVPVAALLNACEFRLCDDAESRSALATSGWAML